MLCLLCRSTSRAAPISGRFFLECYFSRNKTGSSSATRELLVSQCLGEHVILPIRSAGPFPHLIIYLGDPQNEVAHGWICGDKALVCAVVFPLTLQ